MPLITTVEYPAIRAALDTSFSADELPDSLIELDQFVGRAEREVVRRYPTALSEADDDVLVHLRLAVINFAASFIAPSLPDYTERRTDDRWVQERARDWLTVADRLYGLAVGEIELAEGEESDEQPVPIFFTAIAPRGRP